jgi:hypothetical protein
MKGKNGHVLFFNSTFQSVYFDWKIETIHTQIHWLKVCHFISFVVFESSFLLICLSISLEKFIYSNIFMECFDLSLMCVGFL